MHRKIFKNGLYNSLATIATPLFGLITIPYLTRTLGTTAFGSGTMVLAVSFYFTILSSFGIPVYGIREVAKYRAIPQQLNEIFSCLFTISILGSIFYFIIFLLFILTIPILRQDFFLYLIGGINILLSFTQVEWLYQGLEKYRAVAIRALTSRIIASILIFLLIKNTSDVDLYVGIMVASLTIANMYNLYHCKNFVSFSCKAFDVWHHIKLLKYFYLSRLLAAIYTALDVVLLGILTNNFYVGLYSIAIRLARSIVLLVTSLTGVLFPKISEQISQGQHDNYTNTTKTTLYALLLFTVPLAIFLIIFSEQIILLFAGKEFIKSIFTLKILSLLIIIVSFSNFYGVQILYPFGLEHIVTKSLLVGGIISILLNVVITPKFQHNGAAFSILAAEFVILCYQFFYVTFRVKINLNISPHRIKQITLGIFIWSFLIWTFYLITPESYLLKLLLGTFFSFVSFIVVFLTLKEPLILNFLRNKNYNIP